MIFDYLKTVLVDKQRKKLDTFNIDYLRKLNKNLIAGESTKIEA